MPDSIYTTTEIDAFLATMRSAIAQLQSDVKLLQSQVSPTPAPPPPGPQPSPAGTTIRPASGEIIDSKLDVWTIEAAPGIHILRNGTALPAPWTWQTTEAVYSSSQVVILGLDGEWYAWNGTAFVATSDPLPPSIDDGSQNAPAGVAQHPSLLSAYKARPPWKVAGVDYAVGIPAGLPLKDPTAAANLPPGCSVDPTNRQVTVNASGVTLDGFDFGPSGWSLVVIGGDTVVANCNFSTDSTKPLILDARMSGPNLTVKNCVFNGNKAQIPSVQPPPAGTGLGGAVTFNGSGTLTVEYCHFLDLPADAIDLDVSAHTPIIRYNLFEGLGWTRGAHPDPVQFVGDTVANAVISFNTIYQPQGVMANEGLAVHAQVNSSITNTLVDRNVLIATGPSMTMSLCFGCFQDPGSTLFGLVVSNNYLDPTATFTVSGFGDMANEVQGSNLTFHQNINMLTGGVTVPSAGTFST